MSCPFLVFFCARLSAEKTAELQLRYKRHAADKDPEFNEQVLAAFCYPLDPAGMQPQWTMESESYTFTLTQGDGGRLHGFCRRFLPAPAPGGPKQRYPQALCLIYNHHWSEFFAKALQGLELLLKQSELLYATPATPELPAHSPAYAFLEALARELGNNPWHGKRISLPLPEEAQASQPEGPNRISEVQLQVPPDLGHGAWNIGICIARLLYRVPVEVTLTLLAAMLLERRIVLMGQSRDTVSSAVHAATALLYPLRWHHVYLPLLPTVFKDYLCAPMPFIIGLPAQLLPTLDETALTDVLLVDLDRGTCSPPCGCEQDDARLLPWRERLEAGLQEVCNHMQSEHDYEANALVSNVMMGYFVKLLGSYRNHMHPVAAPRGGTAAAAAPTGASGRAGGGGSRRRSSQGGDGAPGSPAAARGGGGGRKPAPPMPAHAMQGYGLWLDQAGFAATHWRSKRAAALLELLRQSQMMEVFLQERLQLVAEGLAEGSDDPFERAVTAGQRRRAGALTSQLAQRTAGALQRAGSLLQKVDMETHLRGVMAAVRRGTTALFSDREPAAATAAADADAAVPGGSGAGATPAAAGARASIDASNGSISLGAPALNEGAAEHGLVPSATVPADGVPAAQQVPDLMIFEDEDDWGSLSSQPQSPVLGGASGSGFSQAFEGMRWATQPLPAQQQPQQAVPTWGQGSGAWQAAGSGSGPAAAAPEPLDLWDQLFAPPPAAAADAGPLKLSSTNPFAPAPSLLVSIKAANLPPIATGMAAGAPVAAGGVPSPATLPPTSPPRLAAGSSSYASAPSSPPGQSTQPATSSALSRQRSAAGDALALNPLAANKPILPPSMAQAPSSSQAAASAVPATAGSAAGAAGIMYAPLSSRRANLAVRVPAGMPGSIAMLTVHGTQQQAQQAGGGSRPAVIAPGALDLLSGLAEPPQGAHGSSWDPFGRVNSSSPQTAAAPTGGAQAELGVMSCPPTGSGGSGEGGASSSVQRQAQQPAASTHLLIDLLS